MNTATEIKKRFELRKLSWWPVLLFVPARFVFAFIAQGVTAAVFYAQGSPDPWHDAASWWVVYSTLTDILTLLALGLLVKYEGIRLIDLFGLNNKPALRQLKYVPLFLLLMLPFTVLASGITHAFYGSPNSPMIEIVDVPVWAAAYSLLIWPVVWVVAEQLAYLGYLLPRLEAKTGKTWLAGVIVAVMWGVQHFAIPFIADDTYLASRVLSSLAATSGFTLAYIVMRRRLVAALGAHWLADASTAFLAAVLPLLA